MIDAGNSRRSAHPSFSTRLWTCQSSSSFNVTNVDHTDDRCLLVSCLSFRFSWEPFPLVCSIAWIVKFARTHVQTVASNWSWFCFAWKEYVNAVSLRYTDRAKPSVKLCLVCIRRRWTGVSLFLRYSCYRDSLHFIAFLFSPRAFLRCVVWKK